MTSPAGNRLQLGLFCTNGHGASQTLVPEAPGMSWGMSVRTARSADAAGFEAVVPFARWKPYPEGAPSHRSGVVFDPFTWAAGIASVTTTIRVFATAHAPTSHPIVAAKQAATVDVISGGRFALNVVGGWSRPELEMFGAPMREHDSRYDHLEEWLAIVRRLWTDAEEFNHHGRFFDVAGAVSMPKPLQPRIPIMNAGGSARGMRFAAEHADLCFVNITEPEESAARKQVAAYKDLARSEFARELQVWTHSIVVQRSTRAEAEACLRRFSVEYEDTAAVDAWMRLREIDPSAVPAGTLARMRQKFAAGAGGVQLVGTPEDISDQLCSLSAAGVDGVLLTWVDYEQGLESFLDKVNPLLIECGLRNEPALP